jgi:NAD(P)-dependent dehydrogenase (short-subunit alcohol dehydrogenase family)
MEENTMNPESFKVVVVTGASAGIGRATALAFARQGADVALLSRNRERLETLQSEIESLGRRALVVPLDVADASAVERAAELTEEALGPIDVWVNNAMVSVFSPVAEMQADEYRRVMEVTFLGAVHGTLAALRRMRLRGRGRIILVGSALAYRGIPLQSAYCAAKHAMQGFNDSLQCELRHERTDVRVTMVQLPAFNTPQFDWTKSHLKHKARPLGTVFQPEFAAEAIVWAAKYGGRELFVGWPTWYTILGAKFFAGVGDRLLARIGYQGQQSEKDKPADSPDNLWSTVPGNYGAHGRFDAVAKRRSPWFWLTSHVRRDWPVLALTAGALLIPTLYHDRKRTAHQTTRTPGK